MNKVVFIKDNSEKIRDKLKNAGFTVCVCASFEDSIWLDYYPDSSFPFDVHGVGYCDPEEKMTPLERINYHSSLENHFSEDREFFDTIEEFLEKYHK